MRFSSSFLLLLLLHLLSILVQASVLFAFAPPPTTRRRVDVPSPTRLWERATFSKPSQAECEALGMREWPQLVKKKGLSIETAAPDTELVRYILEGEGSLMVVKEDDFDDDSSTSSSNTKRSTVQRGTLIRVTGPVTLKWDVASTDMVVLTPSYEQGGLLLGVAGGLVALLAALLFATSS